MSKRQVLLQFSCDVRQTLIMRTLASMGEYRLFCLLGNQPSYTKFLALCNFNMGANGKIVKCATSENAWPQSETDANLGLAVLWISYVVYFSGQVIWVQFVVIRCTLQEFWWKYRLLLFLAFCQIVKVHGTLKITPATLPTSIKLCWFHLASGQAERPGPSLLLELWPRKVYRMMPKWSWHVQGQKCCMYTTYISEAQTFDRFTLRWAFFD